MNFLWQGEKLIEEALSVLASIERTRLAILKSVTQYTSLFRLYERSKNGNIDHDKL